MRFNDQSLKKLKFFSLFPVFLYLFDFVKFIFSFLTWCIFWNHIFNFQFLVNRAQKALTCFLIVFICFTEWRVCQLSLFYYSRWQYFFTCNISSPLPLSFLIRFYIFSKRFFLKRKELFDTRVVSITKSEYTFGVPFL